MADLISAAPRAVNDTAVVRARLARQQDLLAAVALSDVPAKVADLAAEISHRVRTGGKVILFGNGGSNSDASHLAAELVSGMHRERVAVAAISLGDQHAAMTAIGNDSGFEQVFARGVEAFGRPGDVAIGLTTSGRSVNVLLALRVARSRGLLCAVFTGDGGAAIPADVVIHIPSSDTQEIQEATMHLGHTLCELVEATL